jgi:hypothetical protein
MGRNVSKVNSTNLYETETREEDGDSPLKKRIPPLRDCGIAERGGRCASSIRETRNWFAAGEGVCEGFALNAGLRRLLNSPGRFATARPDPRV